MIELKPTLTEEDKENIARARGLHTRTSKSWLRFADDIERAVLFNVAMQLNEQRRYEPTENEGSEP